MYRPSDPQRFPKKDSLMRFPNASLLLVSTGLWVLAATAALSLVAEEPEGHIESPMTQERLEQLLRTLDAEAKGGGGVLELRVNDVNLACVSDRRFDRMRLVAPIQAAADLNPDQIAAILEANFHTALDARYATSKGVLYAVFIHPMSPLDEKQLRSAVEQVTTLARTFGTTYTSGELQFGGTPRDREI